MLNRAAILAALDEDQRLVEAAKGKMPGDPAPGGATVMSTPESYALCRRQEERMPELGALVRSLLDEHDRRTTELLEASNREVERGRAAERRADALECDELIERARVAERRDERQRTVAEWCAAAFGADHAASLPQRGIRLLEEAAEAAQAAGCDRAMAHKLIDYVWDRPVGALAQELGGVGLTLLALASAAGLSADVAEAKELARVLAKPLAHFAARNAAKNAAGFNVTDAAAPEAEER